ncbi:hypothetical protein D3C77_777720 [compost metagenome]
MAGQSIQITLTALADKRLLVIFAQIGNFPVAERHQIVHGHLAASAVIKVKPGVIFHQLAAAQSQKGEVKPL